MSDIRDFVFWFCSILLVAIWMDDLINGYTQYGGTLTGLLLALWLSIAAGSIIFLAIRRSLFSLRSYISSGKSVPVSVFTQTLGSEQKVERLLSICCSNRRETGPIRYGLSSASIRVFDRREKNFDL